MRVAREKRLQNNKTFMPNQEIHAECCYYYLSTLGE